MYKRLPVCIALHNAKLTKLRVEPGPPRCPFSPSQLPGGGLRLPLTLPLQLSSLSILTPDIQALHRPAWLVVREFGKSDLEKKFQLAPAAFCGPPSTPAIVPSVVFPLQNGSFHHVFHIWNSPSTLSKRLSTLTKAAHADPLSAVLY